MKFRTREERPYSIVPPLFASSLLLFFLLIFFLQDTIQYKEIIKQQRRKIDEKEEEIAKIKATLEQADNPKEQTAKTLFDMEGKVLMESLKREFENLNYIILSCL